MIDLFRSELLRFRHWALAYALLHLGMLGFFARVVDPLQQPDVVYLVVAAVYALSGLLLALYQMGTYRRPNTWLNLLHRPLPHWQVAVALLVAAASLLLLAIVAPLLLMLAGQATWTARVVDSRHWLLPLAAFLVTSCSYLAGVFAMLAPRRYAAAGLFGLLLLTASHAVGASALLVQLALVLWLLALVATAFQPDLTRPPVRWPGLMAVALTVQMAVYVLLASAGLGYQLLWMLQGSHPLNSTPPAGGYIEASRADGADLMAAGLVSSRVAEAPVWREQVRLAEVFTWQRQFDALPIRNELGNIAPMEFDDDARRLRWIFSHDTMRFTGMSLGDSQPAGRMGIGPAQAPFPKPPLPIGGKFLASADTVYGYDTQHRMVLPRIILPAGETLALAPSAMGEVVLVMSNRALYGYDARAFTDGDSVLAPRLRIALPAPIGDIDRVDMIELIDGYLVSFVTGLGSTDGPGSPLQAMVHVSGEGKATRVGQRALQPDFPLALRHYPWWVSPVMHDLRKLAINALAAPMPLKAQAPQPIPTSMKWLAAALLMASLLASAYWSRRQGLPRARRVAWALACAGIGVPALLAQGLIHPDSEG
ncbi:MAG: hypothetical protein A3E01_06240 [Gammaproteobacteria bacterium RIFCSPHIGHO2_12_FULL_63_22]|nr:MAG: hypothetical protein A3E01_06240 [Gammaproteobacteria bacterium RIFCSPHIGHO2_12_FULL_63_22]